MLIHTVNDEESTDPRPLKIEKKKALSSFPVTLIYFREIVCLTLINLGSVNKNYFNQM